MKSFSSINPATGEIVWQGQQATQEEIAAKVKNALQAFESWKMGAFVERAQVALAYAAILEQKKELLAKTISEEMGKPLWEALTEVEAMKNKVAISIQAYKERTGSTLQELSGTQLATRFLPYGPVAVLGPFNFPGHLPNGHIVPALLAGNVVIFKPSEHTPKVGEVMMSFWQEANLPEGVLQLVQGAKEAATSLILHPEIAGVYFTGSVGAGCAIRELSKPFIGRILALEMGGNNPLVVSHTDNLQAAVYATIQSAFLTSGQRCSCARRLILVDDTLLSPLIEASKRLVVGPYTLVPEPFMGPVVSKEAADHLSQGYNELLKQGGKALLPLTVEKSTFLTPAIVDMTEAKRSDQELFGPILQVIRVKSMAEAIEEANSTQFGLTAALISDSPQEYEQFYSSVRAGVINWNMPTTGASSRAPFGGIGLSGNLRPSGYFAADYCAYPVASQESQRISLPQKLLPGVLL